MSSSLLDRLESYFDRLWPLCRSIAGPGYRESLDILSEIIPMERLKFETGRQVFDWTVPQEWVPNDAYFIDPNGKKWACFKMNNLHLVGYSIPFHGKLSFTELKKHLHTLPEQPNAIPYVTSYYERLWGFCLSHEEFLRLPDGEYTVVIDTELKQGHIEVGEVVLVGKSDQEVLFSSYLCHPSLANNELSGPLVLAFLYEKVKALEQRRFTYRFVIMPETIGSVCLLSERGKHLKEKLQAGFHITCIGDRGPFTYKKTRRGGTLADRVAKLVLRDLGPYSTIEFDPFDGSDERQYCSPGFNLPVGSLMRTPYFQYKEYHTSLDNKQLIDFDAMAKSINACFHIVEALESNRTWQNTVQYGEPQLGKRGLYPYVKGAETVKGLVQAIMWMLNLADAQNDLLSIADRSGLPLKVLIQAANILADAKLIVPVGEKN